MSTCRGHCSQSQASGLLVLQTPRWWPSGLCLPSPKADRYWYSNLLDFSRGQGRTPASVPKFLLAIQSREYLNGIYKSDTKHNNMNQGFLPKNCYLYLFYTFKITLPNKVFQFFNKNLFCKALTEFGFSDCQFWSESRWFHRTAPLFML